MTRLSDGLPIRRIILLQFLKIALFASVVIVFTPYQLFPSFSSSPSNQQVGARQESNPLTQTNLRTLELGKRIEGTLANEECHSFGFQLTVGEFAHLVIHQRGLGRSLRVDLLSSGGELLYWIDGYTSQESESPVAINSKSTSSYRLDVCARKNKVPGFYWIEMNERRLATPRDADSGGALQIYSEGQDLNHQGNADLFPKIIQKFNESLQLWRVIGDRYQEGVVVYNFGWVYHDYGEYQRALDYFFQSLDIFRDLGSHAEEASTLTSIGEEYYYQGDYDKALDYLTKALPVFRDSEDTPVGEGWTFHDMAEVYSAMGEKEKALDFALRSLRAYQANEGEVRGLGIANTTIGKIYSSIGEKQKALDYFASALPYWRAAMDPMGEARTLHQIGEVYTSLGDSQSGLEYYRQALSIWRRIGYRYGEALAFHSIGTLYISLNDFTTALENLQYALDLRREMSERRGEAYTIASLGLVYQRLMDYQKAQSFYDEALQLWRAVGDRYGEAYTLSYLGEVHYAMGDPQGALNYFNQAVPIRQAAMDKEGEANTIYYLARIDHDRGNLQEACEKIERVISLVESVRANVVTQDIRATYLASVHEYYEFYINVLMERHQINPQAGYDAMALQMNEHAHARSLLEILSEAGAVIRQGIDPQLLDREQSVGRRLSAKVEYWRRLRSLKPNTEQAAAISKEVNALSTEYQEVQIQIRSVNSRYAALRQPEPLSLKEIQQWVLKDDTLLLEYALGDERSYLWLVSPTTLTTYQLPKRTEIESSARRVYELLVARNRRDKAETPEHREKRLAQAEAEYPGAALHLSKILLGPAAHLLGTKRLLIVADDALQYVPFAALPEPVGSQNRKIVTGQDSSAWTPLALHHEIVNLPSASTLAVLGQEYAAHKAATKTVAVLADPVFEKNDPRVSHRRGGDTGTPRHGEGAIVAASPHSPVSASPSHAPSASPLHPVSSSQSAALSDVERSAIESGVTGGGAHIPRLPFARREAEAILSRVPLEQRKAALDFEASLTTATNPDLAQYRIVHFATHGLLNSLHPQLSGLVLSLVNPKGQLQDGFLRLDDIYNLKLPVDLVVLSACQTALGKEIKGEGLIGLTRGFMYAGAKRVMASLWKVDDRATAELMSRFYEEMLANQHLSPAAALRQAQMSLWKEKRWTSPYYWAAFTLQGEWR